MDFFTILGNGPKETRILMIGLDNGGKTTILRRLKLAEVSQTIPTVGFNVETVEYKNLSFMIWDVGGQDKLRVLWRHYYSGTDAIIFVVDSNDKERMHIAKEEIQKLVEEQELRHAKFLIFANKQDIAGCCSATEVVERLGLTDIRTHEWYVQSCSATTGTGLYEGLDWLRSVLLNKTPSS